MDKKLYSVGLVVFAGIANLLIWATVMHKKEESKKMLCIINNPSDVVALFPKTVEELNKKVEQSLADAQKRIDEIIAVPDDQRMFANTAKKLDQLESLSDLAIMCPLAELIQFVYPDALMREAAQKAVVELAKFSVDKINNNVALYRAFKAYIENNALHEKLSQEEKRFLTERMKSFKRNGLDLPEDQLEKVKKLKNKLTELTLQFNKNINEDKSTISVTREELDGLENDFIDALQKTNDGLYILGVDYPTYFKVIQHCDVESTRKQLYDIFNNRAYPVNKKILEEIIAVRDELAKKLGFSSYSQFDLNDQMVGTPEQAEKFLNDLLEKVQVKEAQEFKMFAADLPASVSLSPDGKMYRWNMPYVVEQYKKKHFAIDENKIAEYFPMEKTVEGMLNIYQQFLGLKFEQIPVTGLWDDDINLVAIRDKTSNDLIGYLLLDLYPRPNKFSHACQSSIISAVKKADGSITPALLLIIANFPKSTPNKPSLLQRSDVITFFHEFGHAMHSLLSRTSIGSFAGTNVKMDFVEVPSQMFEEWMWDKDILKQVSSHYKTGKPLSDDLLDTMIKTKNLSKGSWTQRQLFYAFLSLYYFKEDKDIDQIMHDLWHRICVNSVFDKDNYLYANFGHLTEYGAKYYSYLWSLVFALDVFYEIKNDGLLNQQTGKRLIATLLGMGGSKDPHELLVKFLRREPNQENFLKDMELEIKNEKRTI